MRQVALRKQECASYKLAVEPSSNEDQDRSKLSFFLCSGASKWGVSKTRVSPAPRQRFLERGRLHEIFEPPEEAQGM